MSTFFLNQKLNNTLVISLATWRTGMERYRQDKIVTCTSLDVSQAYQKSDLGQSHQDELASVMRNSRLASQW